MSLHGLLEVTGDALAGLEPDRADTASEYVAPPGFYAPLIAGLPGSDERLTVVLAPSTRAATQLARELGAYTAGVELFPDWETLPHERLSPRTDTMARRIWALHRVTHPHPQDAVHFLVMPVRAALAPVNAHIADYPLFTVQVGDPYDRDTMAADLLRLGYERVDMVGARGQFAVRGGLLDVFSPTSAHPVRIELFGDEVDTIRAFTASDQRTFGGDIRTLVAPACRELLLDDTARKLAASLAGQMPQAAEILNLAAEGKYGEGLESLSPLLGAEMVPLFSLLPPGARLVATDRPRLEARATELVETTQEFLAASWSAAAGGGEVPLEIEQASFLTLEQLHAAAQEAHMDTVFVSPFAVGENAQNVGAQIVMEPLAGETGLIGTIGDLASKNWNVVITTTGKGMASRLRDVLSEADVPAKVMKDATSQNDGTVQITVAPLDEGYQVSTAQLLVVSEAQVLGKKKSRHTADKANLPARRRKAIDPLTLTQGDYVVHLHHGIGRFVKLAKRTMGRGRETTSKEYVVLEYAPSKRNGPADQLWVPTDSLDLLSKYVGGESPTLSKMGGADWAKTKSKARKAVKEIARELVRLYAIRQASKGHAFSPDTPWQRELEDSFEFVETPDQLTVIDEVKHDMEQTVPMDRLVCGDVGYGKTEIAVRAAFKAVQDGKQVAILAPTTLLVSQHTETFTSRFAGFPVTVAALSRFTTAKEAAQIKAGLKDGSIEVVIGTHALLSGNVRFKDLGLVVIDEEQRFGVEHKEALKALRADVDVLTMSATPIPRTLEMAITGIRGMSTLTTPPEDRHPVLTYVGAYSDKQVAAAIRRELLRDGQVFFVHNRVQSINRIAAHLTELVPEARVRVGHGQMSEKQLESVMVDFWNQEFDVLVSTTIVENGLDVTNANTIIVDRADRFGLSQLHQLRGRVGRGRERGYAYFLYPPGTTMNETAFERLKTIGTNTGLGSGMAIATKDLEIRGAGNLLGGEQSGHIAGVGFDLYVRMVGEAVATYKGEEAPEDTSVSIELPIDAFIPEDYLDVQSLRLDAYTRLSAATTDEEIDQLLEEMTDRYGRPPEPLERLGAVAKLRNLARAQKVQEIKVMGKFIRFAPVELADSQMARLQRMYPGARVKLATRELFIPAPTRKNGLSETPIVDLELLEWVQKIIRGIIKPLA
ncbi:transcription-repair coupling factor [Mobiluncus curtisii]|uniref:Transcription-repair-coupling factor n=1 Tax=Mobiluncus curtisii TaxID=2051 RepID=A0A7Y0YBL8_9ACTO|nr:transcription-repair coupling factor [Mobiluncus curtisii]MCU9986736.1 transcription-repair coupling factor [Mobiluncus curtisii]MCU9999637.1 transcription-repair coupling factor [Mobiluncus curtisii]NMW49384.1 transcription-repair coupling factor [Mobiluncus curtisii]NMW86470.1 transcription-repair coupling factor [Mobiluncus curtisii]NMX13795.1 transcription-repair coupling factor [Mobiluncus curtisii]